MSMDISKTIEADSSQINAIDFLAGPETITITDVQKGDADQPVWFSVAEYPNKYFKPSKTVRRILVTAWGKDAKQYVGRRVTVFNDPTVRWAGEAIGGIRVLALSHIEKSLNLQLSTSRGKHTKVTIEPLIEQPQVETISEPQWSWLVNAGQQVGLDPAGVGSLAGDLLGAQLGSWQEIPAARLEDIANAVTEYGQAQPASEDQ